VEVAGDALRVRPPSWRGDLARPADLAEEVARLHGYDRIPADLPPLVARGGRGPLQRLERDLRAAVLAAGVDEVVTRPFVGASTLAGALPSPGRVLLANPLAQDAAAMRPGLLDGLLGVLRRNHGQGVPGLAVHEWGRVFRPVGDPLGAALDALVGTGWRWRGPDGDELPLQPRALGLAATGVRCGPGWVDEDAPWSVEDLLGAIDEVVRRAGGPPLARVAVVRDGWHPGRTVALHRDGVEIGLAGALHPEEADRRDLPDGTVAAELLVEPLLAVLPAAGPVPARAPLLVRHPAVVVDVAVVAPETVPLAEVEAAVRRGAGELLDGLRWFDEFRGTQLPDGHRSLGFRLRLQDPERQLTDADAEAVLAGVGAAVAAIGAALRG
ncbi:MAG: phenylalanine--tRNA ligase subunit beta, partial [Nitriliruptoraceae bacterium]